MDLSVNRSGKHPKVSYVVYLRYSANGVQCREVLVGDLHHRGEALGGQLSQSGEETLLVQVDIEPEGE